MLSLDCNNNSTNTTLQSAHYSYTDMEIFNYYDYSIHIFPNIIFFIIIIAAII